MTFIYLERVIVSREDSAITATDENGTIHIPANTLAVLMLGPGASVTHQAVVLLAESGVATAWVGENGVRYYCHGRPLTRSSGLLEAQAAAVSNQRSRLAVARRMYLKRFPSEDVSSLTMQQLRGREGVRMRKAYQEIARRTGVKWERREFNGGDSAADPANLAVSAATSCLYGVVHAVVAALGCAPGLGFVHSGHDRGCVYDMADLYKAETAIPAAFEAAATGGPDIAAQARRLMRERMVSANLVRRCVGDIFELLEPPGQPPLVEFISLTEEGIREGGVPAW
jgi:CRISPR-associated protein Cas1